MGTCQGGLVVDGQQYGLAGQPLEGGPGILLGIEGPAVHGQQVVAFLHLQARLSQRSPVHGVPGRAAEDGLDAEGAVFQVEVRAQQARPQAAGGFDIATAPVGVGGVQLGNELADDEVHVLTGDAVLQELAVADPHGRPVHAMHGGVVEHVPLEAPCVIEDLLPLRRGIHRHRQLARGQLLLELLVGLEVHQGELLLAVHQDLLAVGTQEGAIHLRQHHLLLALLEVEGVQRGLVLTFGVPVGGAPVDQLALGGGEVVVVARRGRQEDHAGLDALQVDLHSLGGLLLVGAGVLVVLGLVLLGGVRIVARGHG